MAEVKTLPDYPRGLTFEHVWAALMEDREQMKRSSEEFDRQMKESREDFDRQIKESREDFDRQMKELREQQKKSGEDFDHQMKERREDFDRQMKERREASDRLTMEIKEMAKENNRIIGKLGNRLGEIIEHIVAPNLRKKFRDLGYDFLKANPNSDVSDPANNIHLEIDVMLENGDKALLVEVKTKPSVEDVREHIERLEKMRKYSDLHGDKRSFLGAVAGVVMTDNVKDYALKQGFFVIEPSGETFNIIPPDNKPKEW